MFGKFSSVSLSVFFFFKIIFLKKSFRNIIKVSNRLDPYQVRHFVGPDLGLNCLQRLSADLTSKQRVIVGVVFGMLNWKLLVIQNST